MTTRLPCLELFLRGQSKIHDECGACLSRMYASSPKWKFLWECSFPKIQIKIKLKHN